MPCVSRRLSPAYVWTTVRPPMHARVCVRAGCSLCGGGVLVVVPCKHVSHVGQSPAFVSGPLPLLTWVLGRTRGLTVVALFYRCLSRAEHL